jgi:hypothetical protein
VDGESAAKAAWNRARVELPDADPTAKSTLPKTRLEEMLTRGQVTDSECRLSLLFQATPCGRKALGGYYAVVHGILILDLPAEQIADPRLGRSKGIAEVMRKLRLGLRSLTTHYYVDDADEYDYGSPKRRTMMAKQLWSANMRRASAIKEAWRSMPGTLRKMLKAEAGSNDMPRVKAAP